MIRSPFRFTVRAGGGNWEGARHSLRHSFNKLAGAACENTAVPESRRQSRSQSSRQYWGAFLIILLAPASAKSDDRVASRWNQFPTGNWLMDTDNW